MFFLRIHFFDEHKKRRQKESKAKQTHSHTTLDVGVPLPNFCAKPLELNRK